MMTFLPKDELKPDDDGGKKGPSTNRIMIWIVVGGIGLYLLGSGIWGILVK
ncbi:MULTISPECIES: hypothetical protein [Cryobacterium]|jgi:hypothetical protein|uniref:Uncharacterized protein n=1 Tax=Cryobacterium arcticum TaxID=670052 RepID=A0A1B1BN58_9MICO|nr:MULTISPECIES: hypothetical protein [Cryobacterium]ANP74069.1 hypothetical protein PA27867_3137 [Cryobacterium arcticum]QYF72813.1 hypothetical protein KY500_13610 [Cryobacterium sp. PAMC25264]